MRFRAGVIPTLVCVCGHVASGPHALDYRGGRTDVAPGQRGIVRGR